MAEADKPEFANLCILELVLKSGERRTVRVENHRGHFKNPMIDGEMEEKFRLSAQKHMRPKLIDNLVHALWNLEDQLQVSALINMTLLQG